MKKSGILLFAFIFVAGFSGISAQKRKLTLQDVTSSFSKVSTKTIPNFIGWEDDGHYVLSTFEPGKAGKVVSVDLKTGAETEYVSKPVSKAMQDRRGRLVYAGKVVLEDSLLRKGITLSPDSQWIAFIYNHNLYSAEIATGKKVQYTFDGSDVILNGVPSWVYYEEILGHSETVLWWSPDSKHIAFFRSDQSKVPVYSIFNQEGIHGSLNTDRYPQPGDPNPEVKVGIVDRTSGTICWADFDVSANQYFGKPFWSPDNSSIWLQWMPRKQNQLKLYSVDVNSGKKIEVYSEEQPTWIDWKNNLYFLSNKQGYIIQSDKDGWDQLYWYNLDGTLKKKITSGKNFWDTKIVKIDEAKKTIYFTSKGEISTRTDFYSVKMDGSSLRRLTFGEYDHRIFLSPGAKYFITNYSNIKNPTRLDLVEVSSGKVIKQIADSKGPEFDNIERSERDIVWFTTNDGFKVPAIVTIPPNIDPTKKYPVMIRTYGGPNLPMVTDRWWGDMNLYEYENVITVILDNRASGHCGKAGLNTIYRQLGKNELADYIKFVTSCLYEKPYVDRNKVSIEGQSYGGYLAALALTKGAEYFKYGIADYGVMDWRLYDSVYTERYMDTPENNPEGYKETSILNYVDNYNKAPNNNLLYIRHGFADDNVHIQNSMQLIDLLQLKNKRFEMQFYPGCKHGYLGPKLSVSNNDATQFYFRHLLNKEVPKEGLK